MAHDGGGTWRVKQEDPRDSLFEPNGSIVFKLPFSSWTKQSLEDARPAQIFLARLARSEP